MNPDWEHFLKNNWSSSKNWVMKEEDWNYFRLKRDKETGQLSATHDPGELTGKSRWRVYDKIFLLFWTNFLGEIIKNFFNEKKKWPSVLFFLFFFFNVGHLKNLHGIHYHICWCSAAQWSRGWELLNITGSKEASVLVHSLSGVRLFVTPWSAAHQASLSFTIFWSLLH